MRKTVFAASAATLTMLSACSNPELQKNSQLDAKKEAKQALAEQSLRIATFNVSMEALNYLPYRKDRQYAPSGDELSNALASDHQQIKNIAEIIQRVSPDIILLNEFDFTNSDHNTLKAFISDYLNKSQNGQASIDFPYFYQGPVNTGVNSMLDMNGNGTQGELPEDGYGFGYFPGHFGMALLSKFPIDTSNIRTFQTFKWQEMPNAMSPYKEDGITPFYDDNTWENARLSSKSHWDIPVLIKGTTLHIIAAHPTPPVFDGPEDRNGKRNHDEIRMVHDYITPNESKYLVDDNGLKGGLAEQSRFVILGDLNASMVDGDAVIEGITSLLTHVNVQDPMPMSKGGKANRADNDNSANHTAHWGMRADYVLPSKFGINLLNSGVFWPEKSSEEFRLIKDRNASSDHRLVWADIKLQP